MLQYLLTGLAGIIVGIVIMRVWSASQTATAASAPDTQAPGKPGASALSTRNLLVAAGVLSVAGTGVLLFAPSDDQAPSTAPAATGMAGAAADGTAIGDVDTMIARLAARLEKNPNDGEGFRMLGWSYVMTGKPDKAIAPYKRALALEPARAVVHSGYGEALVGVAGNTVTPDARAAFEKALSLDPAEPRARYFLALGQAQDGQEKEALDKLVALANSGPGDAPWQADVRRQITTISGKLGIDVSPRLKNTAPAAASGVTGPPALDQATMQAAGNLPAGDRQAMVDSMVEGLATRLKANPGDAQGWAMLLRSRMVQKQADKAAADLVIARKALARDRAGLAQVNAAASDLGVPGA